MEHFQSENMQQWFRQHGFMGGFNQPPPPPPEGGSRQFEPGQDEHMPFNENQNLP
jgi:hypothetical protein